MVMMVMMMMMMMKEWDLLAINVCVQFKSVRKTRLFSD
jgi:hypothetical protein